MKLRRTIPAAAERYQGAGEIAADRGEKPQHFIELLAHPVVFDHIEVLERTATDSRMARMIKDSV